MSFPAFAFVFFNGFDVDGVRNDMGLVGASATGQAQR